MRNYWWLALFFLLSCSGKKETNWELVLDKNRKDPYGCFIAYQGLKELFASSPIKAITSPLKEIRTAVSSEKTNQLMVISCRNFGLDSSGWEELKAYVINGNHVVIFAYDFSEVMLKGLQLLPPKEQGLGLEQGYNGKKNQPFHMVFNKKKYSYSFTGFDIGAPFSSDTSSASNIERFGSCGNPEGTNLIRYNMTGSLTLCTSPMATTNYFLLQGNNRAYFEQLFSHYTHYPENIYWYSAIFHHGQGEPESEWSKLMKIPAIKFALLILIGLMACYLLFESKRRQRYVPILPPHTNTSLEFTETVGSLYYSKRDHKNLASKMILHYLEHLRSTYNLRTNQFNEAFASQLSMKLDQPLTEIKAFISYLDYIRQTNDITDHDLLHLYQQIKKYS